MKYFSLIIAVLFLPKPACAFDMADSPTLKLLQAEESKDPASLRSNEEVKIAASAAYTGEQIPGATLPSSPAAGSQDNPSYHFKKDIPFPGLNMYTPQKDKGGEAKPETQRRSKSPIEPKLIYGPLGLGLAALIAGAALLLTGGAAGPILYALGAVGGAGVGVGGLLYYINKKLSG